MSAIKEIYDLIKSLMDEAKKRKNNELLDKLLDIKLAVNELEDENRELKSQLEKKESIVRHKNKMYVTVKDDPQEIHYCTVCWGRDGKLIQMYDDKTCYECIMRAKRN
jgi:hypothetical protein